MSAAKDGPRDWDKELAEIDKLMAADPGPAKVPVKAGAPAGGAPAHRRTGAPEAPAAGGRKPMLVTWLWFSLAALMGIGLPLWPYARECGPGLYAYLGSIGAFGLAALWSTAWSWRTRAAVVHFLSIGLLFWGTFLGAREVLPRTGYAKQQAGWICPAR